MLLLASSVGATVSNVVEVDNQAVELNNMLVVRDTFGPRELGDPVLWFDFDDPTTITLRTTNGIDYITRIDSVTGTQYIEQVVASDQPIWTNGIGLDGNSVVYFDSDNNSDRLESPGPVTNLMVSNFVWFTCGYLTDTNISSAQAYVFDSSWTWTTNTSITNTRWHLQMDKDGVDGHRWRARYSNDSGSAQFRNEDFAVPTNNVLFVAWGHWYTNNNTFNVIYKGIEENNSNNSAEFDRSNPHSRFTVGNKVEAENNNRDFEDGFIAEIIVYSPLWLSDTDERKVVDYLLLKWQAKQFKSNTPEVF